MNFIVSSSLLSAHLQSVGRVISSKPSMAILGNFLFELNGNILTITGTDIETTMVSKLEVESASGDGKIAIEAKRLTDFMKVSGERPMTFNINEATLQVDIITENGKYNIAAFNGDDFPKTQELNDDATDIKMSQEALLQGVTKALFAASTDTLRPVMTGVFVEIFADRVNFVASDAHKLVRYTRTDITSRIESSFILPPKPANMLQSFLSKSESQVRVAFDKKNAIFETDEYKLVCRLIEGNFPNYSKIIPPESQNKVVIDRSELIGCLRRVAMCANQASNLIKFSIAANQLTVSAQDYDFSTSGHERISCQYDGEEMEIGFKSTFLLDLLKNLDSTNEIAISLVNPGAAGVLTPYDNTSEKEDVLMLLMPMKLED